MNIKKIIKESIDEFDWIRESEPIDLDKEVKQYIDNNFVVAIWFGDMSNDLIEYINKFIIKEGFNWASDRLESAWLDGNLMKGLTFYPNMRMGGFKGKYARNDWESYNHESKSGHYDDIDPNMFHSIEYK